MRIAETSWIVRLGVLEREFKMENVLRNRTGDWSSVSESDSVPGEGFSQSQPRYGGGHFTSSSSSVSRRFSQGFSLTCDSVTNVRVWFSLDISRPCSCLRVCFSLDISCPVWFFGLGLLASAGFCWPPSLWSFAPLFGVVWENRSVRFT